MVTKRMIQGFGSDMVKLALILIRDHINENNLRDIVHLLLTVHDQITTQAVESYAEVWAPKLQELMEYAAEICLGNDLLKAEPEIMDKWKK